MLLIYEESANESRPMREQTSLTVRDVIKNNASMDAEHKEEKQRMQAHFAQLVRNAQEEKQIAVARINAKLHLSDNKTFAFQ